jgi:hypothetical protein
MAYVGDSLTVEQRTLTPLVEVRILVPQPVDVIQLSSFQYQNIVAQLGVQLGVFVLVSSLRMALSPSAGSRLR